MKIFFSFFSLAALAKLNLCMLVMRCIVRMRKEYDAKMICVIGHGNAAILVDF